MQLVQKIEIAFQNTKLIPGTGGDQAVKLHVHHFNGMGGTATADDLAETFTWPQVIRRCCVADRHQCQAEIDLSIAGAVERIRYQQILGQADHCRADVFSHIVREGTPIIEFATSSGSDGGAGRGRSVVNRAVIQWLAYPTTRYCACMFLMQNRYNLQKKTKTKKNDSLANSIFSGLTMD